VQQISRTYEEWQQILASAFLSPHVGPTVLFVDDAELTRLQPDAIDAPRDLAEAVCSQLSFDEGTSLFSAVSSRYRQWRSGPWSTTPPPVLPVIAVTVLAATRMRSDFEARSTNYYLRLAQALLPEGGETEIERLRSSLGDGGEFLGAVEMWRGLHDWIEAQDGRAGTSTIRDHPHLPRIGYPLSQALVRQIDHATLTRFFEALRFHPGPPPTAETLARALDIWSEATNNRLSEPLMHALGDSKTRQLVASIVDGHARAWDGIVLTGDGRKSITVRLGIDLDDWLARWLFVVADSGPAEVTLSSPDGPGEINLEKTAGSDYYTMLGEFTVTAQLVTSGFRTTGTEFGAEFPPSPVVFFRPDPQTGAWSSVHGLIPFEEHLVAIVSKYVTDFEQVLADAADGGWRVIRQRRSALLAGYALYSKVRFSDARAFESALAHLPILRHIGVAPATIPRARLVRGLPIATSISSAHYLTGGEPDLLLPTGPDPRTVAVTLDGVRDEIQANGFPLELRRFPGGAGRHIIDADGQEIAFTNLDEGPDPDQPHGTATLGWTREGKMGGIEQHLAIIGALITDPMPTDFGPVLARRGRDESWLLHDDGRAESLTEPATPPFLDGLNVEIRSPYFEIDAHKSARWLAQRSGPCWRLTELGVACPRKLEVEFDVLSSWERACDDRNGAQLWEFQLTMAGGNS